MRINIFRKMQLWKKITLGSVIILLLLIYFYLILPFWGIPFNAQRHGNPPLTPSWALECWLWEDDVNTAKYVDELLAGYRKYDIPVRTILIDSPWSTRYNDFTVDESNKVLNTMDSITASIIRDQLSGQQSPAIKKVLENVSTQNKLYNAVYEDLIERRDLYDDVLNSMTIKNSEDQFQFEELFAKVNLLNKILNNYGDPELALTGKQKTGVVAYHIQSSRFANIKEIFEDEITDEGQQLAEETQSIQFGHCED